MTNNTEEYELHHGVKIGSSVFLLFDIICGLFGNLVLCIAVIRNKSLRTPMGMLICNLAVTGTIQTLFCVPTLLYFTFAPAVHKTGYAFCYIEQFLRHLSGYVALTTMVNIAYERHQAIAKPFDKTIRVKRVRVTIPCMWLLGVGLALIGTLAFFDDVDIALCLHKLTTDGHVNMQFGVYFTLPIGLLAILLIVYLYTNMLWLVHRHTISSSKLFTKINKVKPANNQDDNDKVNNKSTGQNKSQINENITFPEISIMQIKNTGKSSVIPRNINNEDNTTQKKSDENHVVLDKNNPDKATSKSVICDQGENSENIPAEVNYNTNNKHILQLKNSSITQVIDFSSKHSKVGEESFNKLQGVVNEETSISKTLKQTVDISESRVPIVENVMLNIETNTLTCHPCMTEENVVTNEAKLPCSKSAKDEILVRNGLHVDVKSGIRCKSHEVKKKLEHTVSEDFGLPISEDEHKILNPTSSLPNLSAGETPILLKNETRIITSVCDHVSQSDKEAVSTKTCTTNQLRDKVHLEGNVEGNAGCDNLVIPSYKETSIHSALTLNDIHTDKTSEDCLQPKDPNTISNVKLSNIIEPDVSVYTVPLIDVYDMNGVVSKQKASNIDNVKKQEIVGAVCVMNPKNREKGRRKVEAKTAKTTALAVVCFLICWLPYPTTLLVVYVESRKTGLLSELLFNYYAISVSLSFVSSAVNPFIYGILNNSFKAELKKMYKSCTKCCCKPKR